MAVSKRTKDPFIDEFDMGRIVSKLSDLNNIIDWLGRLKKLDSTLNKDDVNQVLAHIKYKRDVLEKKYKAAQVDFSDEAEALGKAFRN